MICVPLTRVPLEELLTQIEVHGCVGVCPVYTCPNSSRTCRDNVRKRERKEEYRNTKHSPPHTQSGNTQSVTHVLSCLHFLTSKIGPCPVGPALISMWYTRPRNSLLAFHPTGYRWLYIHCSSMNENVQTTRTDGQTLERRTARKPDTDGQTDIGETGQTDSGYTERQTEQIKRDMHIPLRHSNTVPHPHLSREQQREHIKCLGLICNTRFHMRCVCGRCVLK